MQSVSDNYRAIARDKNHKKQTRVDINGVSYYGESTQIRYLETYGGLFPKKVGVGGTQSQEIDVSVRYGGESIPRMARMNVFVRLVLGDEATDWIPKGVFYIDTRKKDALTGCLTIHGYDAMQLANQVYLPEGETGEWPKGADVVAADIAARLGVEIDSRTVLDSSIMVPYPNDYTMREVLGYIAAAHGGNFIITDDGALRLIPLWSIPTETHYLVDEYGDPITFGTEGTRILLTDTASAENPNISGSGTTYLGREVNSLDNAPEFAPYSKVIVWYDDEEAFEAGDDTGRVLECDCPFATQEIADKILAGIQGYVYRPYEAVQAILDPAAELGDGVTVNGIYSVLARIDTEFNALMVSTIAAPADEEIDHEIPYMTATQRALKRKLTLGKMYNNVSITQKEGFQAFEVDADGNKTLRAKIGGGEFILYDSRGRERVYFDPDADEYIFVGSVDIRGGEMNINDKFIVDESGNTRLVDALLKAAALYATDESQYYARMQENALALMNRDSEVPRAVLQADSSMVELVLGAGSDVDGINGRLYVQKGVEGGANVARVRYIDANGRYSTVEFDDTNGLSVDSEVGVRFYGTVDFSGAEVVGLPTAE